VQGGAGSVDRIEVVVFAFAAPVGAVRPIDLENGDAGLGQMSGQAGAVRAGALNADAGQFTELADPGQHRSVAGPGGGETMRPEDRFPLVDDRRDMQLLVGVDTRVDDPIGLGLGAALARLRGGGHAGHVVLPSQPNSGGRHRASTEPADKTVMSTWWRRLSLGHPDGEA
jgi:hypothetical protein